MTSEKRASLRMAMNINFKWLAIYAFFILDIYGALACRLNLISVHEHEVCNEPPACFLANHLRVLNL